jgi:membrane fusion protein (multidrug efflux system)
MEQAMHGVIPPELIAPPQTRWLPRVGKKTALIAGAALIGMAAVWYGTSWWTVGRFIQSTDDAYVGGDVTTIASKVAGFVQGVAVSDNQPVKAGDLLIRLDDRDYRAQLARAEASVDAQNASLANLDANALLQRAMIDQAKAEIVATEAEVERAKYDLERYRALAGNQNAPVQRYQQAEADYKKSLAADQKARAALEAAERKLDVIATQKQQANAALGQAIAERDLARINLSYTEIRSPIDGVVGNRGARLGSYATTGALLLSIVPDRGLWIDANFKENQLARMREGQRVEVVADLLPGVILTGRVASLAPATGAQFSVIPAENATGNFTKIVQRVPVRVVLDDSDNTQALRPGLSVVVSVDERPQTNSPVKETRR